jgi:anion-transporting  ArsA/GET3 family ATPase
VCICAGAGGVGKTTMAAAIALGMATRGLKVAVVTIDPARRLAESLGLEQLGNEPTRVEVEDLQVAAGRPGSRPEGELWAMMLDVRRTLDELVELLLPDEHARNELFGNRIYRQLSNAVAGTQEFMAVAKLYELHQAGAYDLLVLDTPPSRNALDFLDAPDRLAQFLEGRTLQALLRSAGVGARILGSGPAAMLRLLRRLTGVELLEDVAAFLAALGEVRGAFQERAARVRQLLRDDATAFVLVTVAEPGPIEEAIFLARRLRSARMHLAGVVINRVHHDEIAEVDVEQLARALRRRLGASLARRVAENLGDYHAQVVQGRTNERHLGRVLTVDQMIQIPQLDRDVHDLDGLLWLGRFLFASEPEHERLMADVIS